jgi:hypothetical protein
MDLKSQQPAKGILLINDWGRSKMYKAVCDCGHDDCSHTIDVEADETGVSVNIYTRVKLGWGKTRWQHIWHLLTKGYADFETTIVLCEQSALNYAETLKAAAGDVKELNQT